MMGLRYYCIWTISNRDSYWLTDDGLENPNVEIVTVAFRDSAVLPHQLAMFVKGNNVYIARVAWLQTVTVTPRGRVTPEQCQVLLSDVVLHANCSNEDDAHEILFHWLETGDVHRELRHEPLCLA